VHW